MKKRSALLALGVLSLAVTACDWVVSYRVLNQSDVPVETQFFEEDCGDWMLSAGNNPISIPPDTFRSVGGVVPFDPKCVLVRTNDHGVALLEPYTDGTLFVVGSDAGETGRVRAYPWTGSESTAEHREPTRNVRIPFFGWGAIALLWAVSLFAAFVVGRDIGRPRRS